MLGAEIYPITIAEMSSYSDDADKLFTWEQHERLKEFLAVNPEHGDVVPGAGGIRQLLWPMSSEKTGREGQIIYYFRDLNMPLYLIAVAPNDDGFEFDDEFKSEVARLVNEIVRQHGRHWARVLKQPDNLA